MIIALTTVCCVSMAGTKMETHFDVVFISLILIVPLLTFQMKYDLLCQMHKCAMSLNLTEKFRNDHNEDILVFARVPKTASLTINALLDLLKDKNNFIAFSIIDGMPSDISKVRYFTILFNSSGLTQ